LVLTLIVVALLTVVVVGFNSVTRTEQAASRNFSRLHGGDAMAELGLEQGRRLLYDRVFTSISGGRPAITQPGRAVVGEDADTVYLSSASLVPEEEQDEAGKADLNYLLRTNATNNQFASLVYVTNPTTFTNFFRAPWVYVTNAEGQVTGRYAFWIDDEGSRLNLNVADATVRGSVYPTNARPLAVTNLNLSANGATLFNDPKTGFGASLTHTAPPTLTTTRQTPTWGYYFVPEQIRSCDSAVGNSSQAYTKRSSINDLWNSIQFRVAGGMANMTNRDIPPPALGKFGIDRPANSAPADAAGFLNQNIDNETLRSRFANRTFAAKYRPNPARQMAAAILDFTRDPAAGLASGLETVNEDGVPTSHLGVSAPPYLNEIVVKPYYALRVPVPQPGEPDGGPGQIEAQVYVQIELVNPYSTQWSGDLAVRLRRQRFDYSGTYSRGGEQYAFSGGLPSWPADRDTEFTEPIVVEGPIGARSFRTTLFFRYEWQADLEGTGPVSDVAMDVNFQFASVQLLANPDQPGTIRDWAVGTDLPLWTITLDATADRGDWVGGGNSGPLASLPDGVAMSGVSARAVAKNDPRVRTFVDWEGNPNVQAWDETAGGEITMGAVNSDVNFSGNALPGLPKDRTTSDNFFDHPSFAYPAQTGPGVYKSIFDLGRIHTGLQWRTLHMHGQPANESDQFIPDWALLEVLAVTNSWVPATTRLNPSALPYPALTNFTSFAQMATNSGGRLSRAGAHAALLSGFVNLTNPAALAAATVSVGSISNTMPADIPAGVVFSSNDIGTISTNLIAMNFNARWDSFRRANADVYPRGIYSSLGEVVEVSGLGSSAPGGAELNKSQLEGRARVVYESLTPVSDTFTIYSVGEAAEVTTIGGLSRTNWLGGKRLKSQVSWVPVRNAAGEVVRDGDGVPAYRLKQGWTLPVITPD